MIVGSQSIKIARTYGLLMNITLRMISKRTIPKKKDFAYGYTYTQANDKDVKRNTIFLHGIYGTKEEWDFVATSDHILDKTNTY